jgi:thiosulfate sulfurtransferase
MKPIEISVDEAFALLEADGATFVDVRDLGSWQVGHIPGAVHVGDHNVRAFVEEASRDLTTVVYCYHGHSSLGGAAFFQSEGFTDVYSMTAGFAGWNGRAVEQSLPKPVNPPQARPRVDSAPSRGVKPSRRRKWLRRLRSLGRSKI